MVFQQDLVIAFGLGAEVVAHGDVDGLGGHVRCFAGGEQPEIDLGVTLAEVGQVRQQPVPGEGRGGVDHQLVGLAVLLQAADADRQLLQQRLSGAEQVEAGVG
ncbi:hypothetical protein D3C78_519140 [compost metagenome]